MKSSNFPVLLPYVPFNHLKNTLGIYIIFSIPQNNDGINFYNIGIGTDMQHITLEEFIMMQRKCIIQWKTGPACQLIQRIGLSEVMWLATYLCFNSSN